VVIFKWVGRDSNPRPTD